MGCAERWLAVDRTPAPICKVRCDSLRWRALFAASQRPYVPPSASMFGGREHPPTERVCVVADNRKSAPQSFILEAVHEASTRCFVQIEFRNFGLGAILAPRC